MRVKRIHKAELQDGAPMARLASVKQPVVTGYYFVECGQRRAELQRVRVSWKGVNCQKCLARRKAQK